MENLDKVRQLSYNKINFHYFSQANGEQNMKPKNNYLTQLKETFTEGTSFKMFLLSILITGLSCGLYKGMLDNYLAEVVKMGEMDRGVTEFFRELPGIALVFILAVFYMLSAETLYKVGAVIMLAGMGMHAMLPATKVLTTLAICIYSLGEHIQQIGRAHV